MRYRKRPIEVEAMQWLGPDDRGVTKLAEWAGLPLNADFGLGPGVGVPWDEPEWPLGVWCEASQATVNIVVGDWLIREPDGSGVYPCRAADFAAAYEPVSGFEALVDDLRSMLQAYDDEGDRSSIVEDVAAHSAEFLRGFAEAQGAAGMTYDDDPHSPRSVAYDAGRSLGCELTSLRDRASAGGRR